MKKIAVIIRGPSAVGKSTIAELLHKKLANSACIDIDILKHMISEESSPTRTQIAHTVAFNFTEQLINNGYNIILEEIFRNEHYEKFCDLLTSAGYQLTSIFLTASLPALQERNSGRRQKIKDEGTISRLHSEITPSEKDIVINVTKLSNEEITEKILKLVTQ